MAAAGPGCNSARSAGPWPGLPPAVAQPPSPAARPRRPPPAPAPLNPGDRPMTDLTIREAAPASRRPAHRGPYPRIGATFAALARRARRGALARRPARASAVYYDMPGVTPDDQLRAHAGVEVAPGTPPARGALEPGARAGRAGRRACHRGAYAGIAGAWDAAYRALRAGGRGGGRRGSLRALPQRPDDTRRGRPADRDLHAPARRRRAAPPEETSRWGAPPLRGGRRGGIVPAITPREDPHDDPLSRRSP